jgi:hypothetical protein
MQAVPESPDRSCFEAKTLLDMTIATLTDKGLRESNVEALDRSSALSPLGKVQRSRKETGVSLEPADFSPSPLSGGSCFR